MRSVSKPCVFIGSMPVLRDRIDELGGDAEQGELFRVDDVEQRVRPRMERRAVEEDRGRARRQDRHEPVPHHPAGRREVHDAVTGADVAVELVLLEVLEQHATGAVDDALRDAGGARRVQSMYHGWSNAKRSRCEPAPRCGPTKSSHATVPAGASPTTTVARTVGRSDRDLVEALQAVEPLAAVAVAVGGEQHDRLDLAEPVEHPSRTEVGRGRRVHRADRGGTEHDDHRLERVRQPGDDAIAGLHAEIAQRRRHRRGIGAQLVPRSRDARARLVDRDERSRFGIDTLASPQEVLHDRQFARRESSGRRESARLAASRPDPDHRPRRRRPTRAARTPRARRSTTRATRRSRAHRRVAGTRRGGWRRRVRGREPRVVRGRASGGVQHGVDDRAMLAGRARAPGTYG